MTKEELLPKLMQRVEKKDGHWLWTGAARNNKHKIDPRFVSGSFYANVRRELWESVNGEYEAGLYVVSRCDCYTCVNPAFSELMTFESLQLCTPMVGARKSL